VLRELDEPEPDDEPVRPRLVDPLRLVVVRLPDAERDAEPERDVLAGIADSLVPSNSFVASSEDAANGSSGVSLDAWGDGVPQPS
jgi:hypothetical protein